MNLSDFSLLKEDAENYTIGHPKGRAMTISKKGLSNKAQELISKLKREQHLNEGTKEAPVGVQEEAKPARQDDFEYMMDSIGKDPGLVQKARFEEEQSALPKQPEPGQYDQPMGSEPKVTANLEQQAAPQDNQMMAQQQVQPQAPSMYPSNLGGLQESRESIDKLQKSLQSAQKLNEYPVPVPNKSPDEIFQAYQKRDAELERAFNEKKIDPDRYYHNKSTGSRIASALGLILGGLGQGLVGGNNPAQEMIHNAIARDIEAQKEDKSNAMNLWKMNREKFGNEIQANLATQNQYLQIANHKITQAQASTQNAMAQAQLAQMKQGINQQIATNNWMASRAGGGAPGTEAQHVGEMQVMETLNPELWKHMQEKYLPGKGTTRIPMTKEDKEAFGSFDNMSHLLTKAEEFQKDLGAMGALPTSQKAAMAHNLQNEIALELNKVSGLTRLTDVEKKAFDSMVGKLGSGWYDRGVALAQIKGLQDMVEQKRTEKERNLGFQPFKQTAMDYSKAAQWLQMNPNAPGADQVRAILQSKLGAR